MAEHEQIPPRPASSEEAGEQGSVFGNLPGRRPAVRSPRRGEAEDAPASGTSAKAAGGQTGSAPQPKPRITRSPRGRSTRPPGRSPAAEPETPAPSGAESGGVEDLAWAGIAVAAEAATLGVRLLSRAVEAVRKPVDRQ
jgi:hypothetical protein